MVNINYQQLEFYKNAHELTIEIYKITKEFPKDEQYGLTSQIRRACVSIGSNIAEGSGRSTIKDYRSFLYTALGSAKEVEYQLLVAKDLEYLNIRTYDRLMTIMDKIIGRLTGYLKKINKD